MTEHYSERLAVLLRKRKAAEEQLLAHTAAKREGRIEVAQDEIKSLNIQINAIHTAMDEARS